MTLNDLIKQVRKDQWDNVIIFKDENDGWCNIKVTEVNESSIVIGGDYTMPFDD